MALYEQKTFEVEISCLISGEGVGVWAANLGLTHLKGNLQADVDEIKKFEGIARVMRHVRLIIEVNAKFKDEFRRVLKATCKIIVDAAGADALRKRVEVVFVDRHSGAAEQIFGSMSGEDLVAEDIWERLRRLLQDDGERKG